MTEIVLVRHGQASFGAEDYDVLSELGHSQARALGRALAAQGLRPTSLWRGAMRRHRETLEGLAEGLGLDAGTARVDDRLNEFEFGGLLEARYPDGTAPEGLHTDPATNLRELRAAVPLWQQGRIAAPPESWQAFSARIRAVRGAMAEAGGVVLAVSSGGAIGHMVADTVEAPLEQMIHLQLQIRNCAVSRFHAREGRVYLTGFNETPHVDASTGHLLSYV